MHGPVGLLGSINWPQAFLDDKAWLDVLVVAALGVVHGLAWWGSGEGRSTAPEERIPVATSITATVSGEITAVGILIPATLVAVQIVKPTSAVLAVIFFADVWFALSLTFGLYILWTVAVKASTQNVLNRHDVGLVYGLQFITLLAGIVRLLIGIAILFSGST